MTDGPSRVVSLNGWLICASDEEAARGRANLPQHLALTRAEPGCLSLELVQHGPLIWRVEEQFCDRAAFVAHQERTRGSAWYKATAAIRRGYQIKGGEAES
jgi:quinol monooxygenase YgiN